MKVMIYIHAMHIIKNSSPKVKHLRCLSTLLTEVDRLNRSHSKLLSLPGKTFTSKFGANS